MSRAIATLRWNASSGATEANFGIDWFMNSESVNRYNASQEFDAVKVNVEAIAAGRFDTRVLTPESRTMLDIPGLGTVSVVHSVPIEGNGQRVTTYYGHVVGEVAA